MYLITNFYEKFTAVVRVQKQLNTKTVTLRYLEAKLVQFEGRLSQCMEDIATKVRPSVRRRRRRRRRPRPSSVVRRRRRRRCRRRR